MLGCFFRSASSWSPKRALCVLMIDRDARNRLAGLIRSLVSGKITNDEFEECLPESKDNAIAKVFYYGPWRLYSDMKAYKLKGKDAITREDRSIVARWILFLKSDDEYEWPSASFKEIFLKLVTLGKFGQSTIDKWHAHGDVLHWPFKNNCQFNNAKLGKGYLGTKRKNE